MGRRALSITSAVIVVTLNFSFFFSFFLKYFILFFAPSSGIKPIFKVVIAFTSNNIINAGPKLVQPANRSQRISEHRLEIMIFKKCHLKLGSRSKHNFSSHLFWYYFHKTALNKVAVMASL